MDKIAQPLARGTKKKEKRLKSLKSEMKKRTLVQVLQK